MQSESEKATNKEKLEASNPKLDARNPKLEAGNPKLFKFSPSAKQKLVFVNNRGRVLKVERLKPRGHQ